jgi:mono/diheme cytochrome c family protein
MRHSAGEQPVNKLVKWVGIAAASAVVIGAGLVAAVTIVAERKQNRVVQLPGIKPVAFTSDAAAIERGKYLFASRGCGDCHAPNGAGRVFIDDEKGGMRVRSPNISPGPGSVVARYTELDWVRAIRHGVKPDGRPLMVMPVEDYNRMTDADLAALVGYTRSLPPAQGGAAEFQLPLPVRAVYALGVLKDGPEKVDHSLPPAQPVAEGINREHGAYVANLCKGCHNDHLSGGKIPGAPPAWPAAANLTSGEGSGMRGYDSVDRFKAMLRSGQAPDGRKIAVMPFATLREINDVDAAAMYEYLKSLPPRPFGG